MALQDVRLSQLSGFLYITSLSVDRCEYCAQALCVPHYLTVSFSSIQMINAVHK